MKPWRIYYLDGTTYSSDDGSPYDAPALGVLVIRSIKSNGEPWLVRGSDFYVWIREPDNKWVTMDIFGVMTSYITRPGPQKIIVGALMPDSDAYWDLNKRALAEGFD